MASAFVFNISTNYSGQKLQDGIQHEKYFSYNLLS